MQQNGFSWDVRACVRACVCACVCARAQKEEEVPYAERNEFHVFLNVKKCKDGQETSQ